MKFRLILSAIVILYILMNLHIIASLAALCSLYSHEWLRWPVMIIFIFLAANTFISFRRRTGKLSTLMYGLSGLYMGCFIYLFLYIVLSDLLVLLGIGKKGALTLCLILAAATIIYGICNARKVRITVYDLFTDRKLRQDYRLVLLSDLHVGAIGYLRNLRTVSDIISYMKADLICIAGDLYNDSSAAVALNDETLNLLKSFPSRFGTFLSVGNHDAGNIFSEMIDFSRKAGIKVLIDEAAVINDDFVLAGRMDSSPVGNTDRIKRISPAEFMDRIPHDRPLVVMDHNPANIREYGNDVMLLLSGHSHHGQIFPGNLITKMVYLLDYGFHHRDETTPDQIISSGCSTWGPPLRVGTDNEVVFINIHSAK